jgi:hypothetical protein
MNTAEEILSQITGENGIYLTKGMVRSSDALEAMELYASQFYNIPVTDIVEGIKAKASVLAIKRYGDNPHLYAAQRDGFIDGYNQAMEEHRDTNDANKVWLQCIVCGDSFKGEEPKMCCDGSNCGCLGQPIDPIVCSENCFNNLPFRNNLKDEDVQANNKRIHSSLETVLAVIKGRMGRIPDEPNLSERGAYDAYLNCLNWLSDITN